MKLTTKIIFGIILSIFVISLLFIIGFSFSDRKNYYRTHNSSNVINIPQNSPIGIDVAPARVILLEMERTDTQDEIFYRFTSDNNSINLSPMTAEEENKLFISEALYGYVAAKTNNDTLRIQIKVDELRKKYEATDFKNYVAFSGFNLNLQTSNANVVNTLNGFLTKVSNIETDTIRIVSNSNILIESCKAIVIEPVVDDSHRKVNVRNSVAKEIHLDLDGLRNWNLEGCNIEVQNFTGSGRHNITLDRNKAGKINWYPKNENAELNIKVQGDTAQIVFQ